MLYNLTRNGKETCNSTYYIHSTGNQQTMTRILVKESTVVRPAAATPRTALWISNLDMMLPMNHHSLAAYFFRFNGAPNFFDSTVLKAALGRALVPFYPMAGRLKKNGNRVEIDCNGEGVLFVDAEFDDHMDQLEDLYPKPDLGFAPVVDYTQGISTYQLFLVQVTRFKCGGVCLGIANEHHVSDGVSASHFLNTWADMARGQDVTIPPFLDRRAVLSARNPPQPQFTHVEYEPHPTLKIPQPDLPSIFRRFKLTRDQLNILKANCNENNATNFTTFEVVAAHSWRCVTKARRLPEDQVTKMYIPVNGRSRMRPPVPQGYLGNVLFSATPVVTTGELLSKPLKFSVDKVHNAIAQFNHDYCISALDYLELQGDLVSMARGPHAYKNPNLAVVGWASLPLYDMNFGWGRPMYVGQGAVQCEGKAYVMASPLNDGSIWYAIALPEDQMQRFEEVFYADIRI